jgi:cytochrome P450
MSTNATDSTQRLSGDRLEELYEEVVSGRLAISESAELRRDPHPLYHLLRERQPILGPSRTGELLLTRWADCEAVLRDPRFSSNPRHQKTDLPLAERSFREQIAASGDINTLLFLDPPDHTRIRGLVSKAFTPRTVERLRPHIAEICDGILDDAAERGSLDVVADLGYVLPVTVICEMLGVPTDDRDQFGPWSSAASRLLDGFLDDETMNAGMLAMMQLLNYLNQLFDERRAHPGDDLISGLIAAEEQGDRLSEEELRSIVLLLFVAGHETTMNLIGNGTWALLGHPDQLGRLRDDPSLIGSCVEELLRFDGPVHLTGRVATCDLEVAGRTIPQGQAVVTLLAAANRDPAQYDEPDRLDIGRADNRHLTFSHGIHYCLGAALARAEGQVAIGSLVRRFPKIEATETPTYREHFVLRGLDSLQVSVA